MIYKISHTFAPEIFVPWISIGRNPYFTRTQENQPVIMSDGKQAEVILVREIHILSEEAQMLSLRLYQVSAIVLMQEWYKRNPCMTDLFFCNIKLRKYEVKPDATAISEDDLVESK